MADWFEDAPFEVVATWIGAASAQASDYAGPVATCPTCGTSVGPIVSPIRVSSTITCGCGSRMTAWSTASP